jgi:hypothetical protein
MTDDARKDDDLTDEEFDAWIARMRIPEILDARGSDIEAAITDAQTRMADVDRRIAERRAKRKKKP